MDKSIVIPLIAKAHALELAGLDFLDSFTVDEVCREYNGVGPQFLPEKLRNKVTEILAVFEPAALIHDLRFGKSNGSREAFDYANEEFVINCRKCAEAKYGALNPKRYRYYAVIKAMNAYNCADFGGHRAWIDAYQKNKENS